MDQVFRVMQHHDAETHAMARLVFLHALVDPIEAVAFGSGAIVRARDHVHGGVLACLLGDGAHGWKVVRIDADKEVIVPIAEGRHVMLQHPSDDRVFAPKRYKDGDGTLAGPAKGGVRGPGKRDAAGRKPDQGDKKVVQTANHDPYRDRHQESRDPVIQPLDW